MHNQESQPPAVENKLTSEHRLDYIEGHLLGIITKKCDELRALLPQLSAWHEKRVANKIGEAQSPIWSAINQLEDVKRYVERFANPPQDK